MFYVGSRIEPNFVFYGKHNNPTKMHQVVHQASTTKRAPALKHD
jgi:hypothetical protein